MKLIGDPHGLDVLDVGCGEGFYTRLIRERGAARVTGIDQSHGMIELARTQEAQHRLGIEYIVGDAGELPVTRQFDLVMAAYLLNYAQDPQELQAMYDGLARSLRPGGRFVTVNGNPTPTFPSAPSYRKYGFETSVRGRWQEGVPITGPSTCMMDPSRSRTTISARRLTRQPVASPDFGRFDGIPSSFPPGS